MDANILQQAINYIRTYQKQGCLLENIIEALQKQGVSNEVIKKALSSLEIKKAPVLKNTATRIKKSFYVFVFFLILIVFLESLVSYTNQNIFGNFENLGLMGIPLIPVYLLGQGLFLIGGILGIIGVIWAIRIGIKKSHYKHSIILILPSLILLGSTAIMPSNISIRSKIVDPVVHSVVAEKLQERKKEKQKDVVSTIKDRYKYLQKALDENGGTLKVIDAYYGEIYLEGGYKIHTKYSIRNTREQIKWDSFSVHKLLGKNIGFEVESFEKYEYKNMKAAFDRPGMVMTYESYIEALGKVKSSIPVKEITLDGRTLSDTEFENFDLSVVDFNRATKNFQNFYGWDSSTGQFKASKYGGGYAEYFKPRVISDEE